MSNEECTCWARAGGLSIQSDCPFHGADAVSKFKEESRAKGRFVPSDKPLDIGPLYDALRKHATEVVEKHEFNSPPSLSYRSEVLLEDLKKRKASEKVREYNKDIEVLTNFLAVWEAVRLWERSRAS